MPKKNRTYVFAPVLLFLLLIMCLYFLYNQVKNTEAFSFCGIDETDKTQHEKHEFCKKLSNKVCTACTCCILLDGKKCVGRTGNEPTYKSIDGNKIAYDYVEWKGLDGEVNCIGCSNK